MAMSGRRRHHLSPVTGTTEPCGRHADGSIYELTTISSFVRSAVRKVREVARTVRIRTRCLLHQIRRFYGR